MNLKLKAALYTFLYVLAGLGVGFVASQLPTWAVVTLVCMFGIYLAYTLIHTGLKYDEAVKEISKKYE
jgi:hypothetical protein